MLLKFIKAIGILIAMAVVLVFNGVPIADVIDFVLMIAKIAMISMPFALIAQFK